MKRLLSLIALIGLLALFSCKKSKGLEADGLQGSWQLMLVNDLATGTSMAKPVSEPKEVTIAFCCTANAFGQFLGNTPSNTFSGVYNNASAQLLDIASYGGTKVIDTPWGTTFADNFIQSESYSFDANGRLQIHTPAKTLVFERR